VICAFGKFGCKTKTKRRDVELRGALLAQEKSNVNLFSIIASVLFKLKCTATVKRKLLVGRYLRLSFTDSWFGKDMLFKYAFHLLPVAENCSKQ
jgi:hypothetical protein